MCGRFTLTSTSEELASFFDLEEVSDWQPRYNIAPSQAVAAILPDGSKGKQMRKLRWGLIPSWAKEPGIGAKLINARAETVSEKPSFRSAFKYRRCLIVADGFYEWQALANSKTKQPYYFQLKSQQPFGFAGLWESWQDMETCTIITTAANDLLQKIHDRMPVILPAEHYDTWLDPNLTNSQDLQNLLQSYNSEAMTSHPVSSLVNSPKNDSPACLQALEHESL